MKKNLIIISAIVCWIGYSLPVVAATRLTDVQSKFYGTSQRLIFVFDKPVKPLIYQDWEEQKIVISEPSVEFDGKLPASATIFRNFVINDIRISGDQQGRSSIVISTAHDFVLKVLPIGDQNLLGIDVFATAKAFAAEEYFNRGKTYESLKQYQKALASYRKAIKQRPRYSEAYFRAGLIRMHLGDQKNALINFQQIPKSSPLANQAATYIRSLSGEKNVQLEKNQPDVAVLEFPSEAIEPELERPLPAEELAVQPDSLRNTSPDSTTVKAARESTKTIISGKRDAPPNIELAAPAPQAKQQPSNELILGFWTFIAELNSFLFNYWHVVIPVCLAGSVLLILFIYKTWPKIPEISFTLRRKRSTKKISKLLNKELEKEMSRRRSKIDDEAENVPIFAQKLADLYKKTDSQKETEIRQELEKENLPRDPLLLDEELEKRGRIMNKMLGDVDSETVRLTKQFRNAAEPVKPNQGKYEAVIQLKNQNWPDEDIARELNMGVEEVKLAVGMWEFRKLKNPVSSPAAPPETPNEELKSSDQTKTANGQSEKVKTPLDIESLRKKIKGLED